MTPVFGSPQWVLNQDEGDEDSIDDEEDAAESTSTKHCDLCPYGDIAVSSLTGLPRLRAEVHLTFESPEHSSLARVVSLVIMLAIMVSTAAFILSTLNDLRDYKFWDVLETIVVLMFTVEYVCRLLCVSNVFRFMIRPLNMIDALAILPFYVELGSHNTSGASFRIIRVVRLARIFRMFKASRYSSYMQIMGQALGRSVDAFGLLLFFVGVAVVVFSSVMYFAEKGELVDGQYIRSEDGSPTPFTSIPATFYWCIITMTTVGYGDVTPVTPMAKGCCRKILQTKRPEIAATRPCSLEGHITRISSRLELERIQ